MTWSLFLAVMLVPFYVGFVCWCVRPLARFISRRWPRSFLLISWRV